MSRALTRTSARGFSLLELLVAMGLFTLLAVLLFGVIDQIQRLASRSAQNAASFQAARDGFELISRTLGQATLNTSYEYYDAAGRTLAECDAAERKAFRPVRYGRHSDLHMVSGPAGRVIGPAVRSWSGEDDPARPTHAAFFQAPLGFSEKTEPGSGLDQVLNAAGFYVEFNTDEPVIPAFVSGSGVARPRARYRLMHFQTSSAQMLTYRTSARQPFADRVAWFRDALSSSARAFASARPVAENVIALVLEPRVADPSAPGGGTSLAADYFYDSRDLSRQDTRHQLPPTFRVTMVAVDETSAVQREDGKRAPQYLRDPAWFTEAARYNTDLDALQAHLSGLTPKVSYRVLTADVAIAGAKWSQE